MNDMIQCLKLSHVPRWVIIDTMKSQSVGEHTFRIMVLCDAIAKFLIDFDIYVDELSLFREALVHDAEESETGDIPSPFKRKLTGDKLDKQYTDEGIIIKLADTIEPIIFLKRYGINSKRVENELLTYCTKTIDRVAEQLKFNGHVKYQFKIWIDQVIRAGGQYE